MYDGVVLGWVIGFYVYDYLFLGGGEVCEEIEDLVGEFWEEGEIQGGEDEDEDVVEYDYGGEMVVMEVVF